MSIPQMYLYNSFSEWAIITNSIASEVGDLALFTGQNVAQADIVHALNNLDVLKYDKVGGAISGWTTIGTTLGVSGATTLTGLLTSNGNITLGTNVITLNSTTGNATFAGTMSIAGATILSALSATTLTTTGAVSFGSTSNMVGNFSVNTSQFTVTASNGNTAIAGTLGVAGATTLSSTLGITGNLSINSNKFTVTASNGNTAIAGTLGVTGVSTLNNTLISSIGAITTNTPFLNLNQTWNNSGVSFVGLLVNIINTASAPTSLLMNFQQSGVTTFGVSSGGTVLQSVAGASGLSRIIINNTAEARTIREYQDLNDSSMIGGNQGLDAYSVTNWAWNFNSVWNIGTSTYIRDRTLANDHSAMVRFTEDISSGLAGSGWSHQWLFSSNVSGSSAVSWTKKVQFDLLNDSYTFGTTNPYTTGTGINGVANNELPISGNTNVYNLNATNNVSIAGNISIGSTTTFSEYVVTTATVSPTILAAISNTVYRTAIFSIQAYDSISGKYHLTQINCIHNVPFGSTIDYVEFGTVATSGVCGTYSMSISGGNMVLTVTAVSSNSTVFKVFTTLQAI